MGEVHGSRRKDVLLRRSIERIQSNMWDLSSGHRVYSMVMEELCRLSDSPLAFILEGAFDPGGTRFINGSCVLQRTTSPEFDPSPFPLPITADTRTIYEALNRSRGTVLDEASLAVLSKSVPQLPGLTRALLMPIPAGIDYSISICVANSTTPYHSDFSKRAWPLLSLCASLIRILDNQQSLSPEEKRLLLIKDSWKENFCRLEAHSPVAMVTLDKDYHILRFNPAAERIFGHKAESMIRRPIQHLIPERFNQEHQSQTFNPHVTGSATGESVHIHGLRADATLIELELSVFHCQEHGQKRTILMMWDRTDLHYAQARHQSELERFRVLADLSPMGILQTDGNWHTDYVNKRWLDITQTDEPHIDGLNWSRVLHDEDAEQVLTELHEHLSSGKEFRKDCRIVREGGHEVWVQFHARPLLNRDGDICGFLSTLLDNSYYHESEEKLRHLAERDILTGLANRMLFFDRLDHALKRMRRHGALALLALDLDGFKNINDTLGHDTGDEMLVEVSKRIQSCVRQEDTVARLGGDEFMILLEDLQDAMTAASVSEKILKALEHPFTLQNKEVYISTSIGICFALGGKRSDAKTLIKQADMALYRAKDAGRNNFQYFSPELELASKRKLELGNSLHQALLKTEFDVHFQAQASVQHKQVVGFEALLRWQHPEQGLLPPNEFVYLLEETGLINGVSRWTLHVCMQTLKQWIDQGLVAPNTVMSVNISPKQFHDPMLIPSIEGAIRDAGLSGENLVVEITETTLLQDHEQTRKALEKIKKLGAKVALDDFGTGYSSLSYLKKYPIDIIKIDRSFIKDLLVDSDDAAIVQAVLALAHSLSLEVIAEGVDSDLILAQLQEWNCDHYQGYLINRPMQGSDMSQFLCNYSSAPEGKALKG
ncbi:putative bifunctional diguanylate cyclase/phosphodiesterase [Ketobacter sp.]|uniref:putative bifunctional diguanylate cyclase/phosphodiesterase n=1 Tax=Ketobacter sp. TaxID=2083498 RepID=UPI000F1B045D|nr:bifunctional diguanylate cyclase/phosphodiesterase [Ketobacter sp.]RLU01028.1 MAG: bifunctional diguanylate cyclase/phosphodiesterase [Ketobacter sp.]